jgi:prepilin-type N-terminal cleavage/methylation domain-containing protein
MHARHRLRLRSRDGFTLPEIIVVVAIMLLLSTLLFVAVRQSITGARISATKATIKIADAILQSRVDAYKQSMWADPLFYETLAKLPRADGAGGVEWVLPQDVLPPWCGDEELRALFVKKYLFSRAFPQTWSEVADWLGPEANEQPPTVVNRATESAEVLAFLLKRAPASFQVDSDAINPAHVRDSDGNGKVELCDAWGNPIRWYRWPTRLVRPDGWPNGATIAPAINPDDLRRARVLMPSIPGPQSGALGTGGADDPLNNDPDDGQRVADPARQTCIAPPDFEDAFHTMRTWSMPLIVSAGPDGLLGLNEPNDRSLSRGYWANPIGNGDLYDNISNQNVR